MGKMGLKEAYKQAFQEEIEKLKSEGKMVIKEGLEDSAEMLYSSLKSALKRGAELSKTTGDDLVVGFLPTLDKVVEPKIDDINPDDNAPA